MQSNSTLKGVIMNDKTKSVNNQDKESLLLKVMEFLLLKEFDVISKTFSLDIKRTNPEAKPRKYLFGIITLKPRQEFIGTVSRFSERADTSNYLVFEVYSREHIDLVKQLAREMTSNFNTKIILLYVKGQLGLETYYAIKYLGV